MTDLARISQSEALAHDTPREAIDNPPAVNGSPMESQPRTSRDERLHISAAGHHALAADNHDRSAARYERDGESESAARERALAQDARDKAQRSRDQAALCAGGVNVGRAPQHGPDSPGMGSVGVLG